MQRFIAADRHQIIGLESQSVRSRFMRRARLRSRTAAAVALAHEVRVERQVGGRKCLATAESVGATPPCSLRPVVADAAMAGANEHVGRGVPTHCFTRHDQKPRRRSPPWQFSQHRW